MADLEKRVIKYETWFDRRRLNFSAAAGGKPIEQAFQFDEKHMRREAIIAAFKSWNLGRLGKKLPPEDYSKRSDFQIEAMNSALPTPLPKGPTLIHCVYQLIEKEQEFIKFVMSHRRDLSSFLTKEQRAKMYVFDLIDAATCCLYSNMLVSSDTELMVIEADLADRVLRSTNMPINAEDMACIPFNQCFIEFSKPVTFVECNGKYVQAVGIGFYKNTTHNCYSAIWYRDDHKFSYDGKKTYEMSSMCSVTFAPFCHLHRVIIDDPSRSELGFPPALMLDYVGGNTFGASDEVMATFDEVFHIASNDLLEKTRNIWDFVTSRNIDYQLVHREAKELGKGRAYKHMQGQKLGPRVFKVLKINRTVRRPEEEEEAGGERQTALGYRERVPGSFHKWIYCKNCDRCHRHDLIGKPCRRCKQMVGPISNLVIRKWWHDEYWRGDGEIKQVVREVRES